ncbi:MAG: hypothetical protein AB2693_16340 [Candidatus Thiodiazotropha sp.]
METSLSLRVFTSFLFLGQVRVRGRPLDHHILGRQLHMVESEAHQAHQY